MNQNMKFAVIGLLAAFLALMAGVGYQKIYSQPEANESQANVEEEIIRPVTRFLELQPQSGPPEVSIEAVEEMISLLTKNAQERIAAAPSQIAGLAMFSGIQDLPDQGTEILGVAQTGDTAEVETKWNYSGMISVKKFQMVEENGQWKIEAIR